jgi:hypothetical protein
LINIFKKKKIVIFYLKYLLKYKYINIENKIFFIKNNKLIKKYLKFLFLLKKNKIQNFISICNKKKFSLLTNFFILNILKKNNQTIFRNYLEIKYKFLSFKKNFFLNSY